MYLSQDPKNRNKTAVCAWAEAERGVAEVPLEAIGRLGILRRALASRASSRTRARSWRSS